MSRIAFLKLLKMNFPDADIKIEPGSNREIITITYKLTAIAQYHPEFFEMADSQGEMYDIALQQLLHTMKEMIDKQYAKLPNKARIGLPEGPV